MAKSAIILIVFGSVLFSLVFFGVSDQLLENKYWCIRFQPVSPATVIP
jgi:hypothetical protein